MKFKGGIYAIVVDGVGVYYGESANIKNRWSTHRKQLSRNSHVNPKLRVAWKEYGPDKFHFKVLEQSELLDNSKAARLLREAQYIANDPLCLNTRGNFNGDSITLNTIPDRPIYRNRKLILRRIGRKNLVNIIDADSLYRLGVETITIKMKLGTFYSDDRCNIRRTK